jgi:hypothetical protein
MRFLRAVFAGYFWAGLVVAAAAAAYLLLYKEAVQAPAMEMTPWQSATLLLRLHFDTFLWVWAVTGVVLSCMHAVATKPIISIRIDGLARGK